GRQDEIHTFAARGDVEKIKDLLTRDPALVDRAFKGETPLHIASRFGRSEVVKVLLAKGADVERKSGTFGYFALHFAAENGHLETAAVLLKNHASVMSRAALGRTALHLASENGHEKLVLLLLKAGAEKNGADDVGKTALHFAASHGHKDVLL